MLLAGAQVGSWLCTSCLRECIRQRAHCDLRAHCVTTCSGPSHQTNVHHPVCHWSAAWEHEVQGEASIVLIRNYPQPACWRGAWSVLWLLPAVQVTESATILSQRAGEEPWSVLWLCQPSRLRNIMHWGEDSRCRFARAVLLSDLRVSSCGLPAQPRHWRAATQGWLGGSRKGMPSTA